MSNHNLIQLPIESGEIIKLLSAAHDMKMAVYQQIYEGCNAETPEGQALMGQVENLVVLEQDSHNSEIELVKQNQDLQTKNDILVRTLEIVRENKEEVLHRMETYRVRAERIQNSQRAADRNAKYSAAYEQVNQKAQHQNGRR